MKRPRLLVYASGSRDGGGSGFEKLVEASRLGILQADIVGVVSNHANGGVWEKADRLEIPFIYFSEPRTPSRYRHHARWAKADFVALSGWLYMVKGFHLGTNFNSATVFNIHPGPLPDFGGKGMYGHHVHEAVMAAFGRNEITHTEINMHFATKNYDEGPRFFTCRIKIRKDDTPKSLGARVNRLEHKYQPLVTNLVVNGGIRWDGKNPKSLVVPEGYQVVTEDNGE